MVSYSARTLFESYAGSTIRLSSGTSVSISSASYSYYDYDASPSSFTVPSSGMTTVTVNRYNLEIEEQETVYVYFARSLNTYTISASAGSGGSISPSGSVSVTEGNSKTFSISANTNYKISSITVDGSNISGVSGRTSYSKTFSNVSSNHSISASFYYDPPITYYTISASAGSGGSISPSGSVSVQSGYSKTFTVTSNTGYIIDKIKLDGTIVHSGGVKTANYTISNVTANHTLAVTFKATWDVTLTWPSSNSHITTVEYRMGTSGNWITATRGQSVSVSPGNMQIRVTPETGYNFSSASWVYEESGEGSSTTPVDGIATVTIDGDMTITLSTAIKTYTITTTKSPNNGGTISPENPTVNHGASQTFQITPASGYHIQSVTLDGTPIQPDS